MVGVRAGGLFRAKCIDCVDRSAAVECYITGVTESDHIQPCERVRERRARYHREKGEIP